MKTLTKHIEGVGDVLMIKNDRAKRVSIKLKPFNPVSVTVPKRVSYKYAENFVITKSDWIKQKLEKMKAIENEQTVFDENTVFRTRFHELHLSKNDKKSFSIRISKPILDNFVLCRYGKIKVSYPEILSINDIDVQSSIKQGVVRALRNEANDFVPRRLRILAKAHGLTYETVRIKDTKTRWGSCSRVNNINISLHVMRLPDDLIDYLLLHELAHTVEKNHGKQFWLLLDRLCGNSKYLDKQLSNYRLDVF